MDAVITDTPVNSPPCISTHLTSNPHPPRAPTSQPDGPSMGVLAEDGIWAPGSAEEVEDDPYDDYEHHDSQQEEDIVVMHSDLLESPAAHQRAGQQCQVHCQQDGEHAAALLPHFLGGRSGGRLMGLGAERGTLAGGQAGFVILVSAAHAGVWVSDVAVLPHGLFGHGSADALAEG